MWLRFYYIRGKFFWAILCLNHKRISTHLHLTLEKSNNSCYNEIYMKAQQKTLSVEKTKGRFYTPKFIVNNILDMSGYYGPNVIKRHAIDNSCGDGAFLTEIVERYCKNALEAGLSHDEIACDLGIYIHGIEIDSIECDKCIANVRLVAQKYDIPEVAWDIKCGDTMKIHEYDGKMDFVLGNPPYVRVHNVGDSFEFIKQFSFAQTGMTDFYIVFYEIGLKMLSETGVLGYITPSSFFNSLAGEALRKHLVQFNLIEKIIDLKHYQAFAATTYTTIVILKKKKSDNLTQYYRYDEKNLIPYYVDSLSPNDFFISNTFYFSYKNDLRLLRKIFTNLGHCNIAVKNGYATLCDDVFVSDFNFESDYIIPVIKASTGRRLRIFYPYGLDSQLIPESELKKDNKLYQYLLARKTLLTKRSSEKQSSNYWYAFGRSQAIGDTYKNKLTINTLLRTVGDLKLIQAPAGVGVYGGLYLVGDTVEMQAAQNALISDEFISYITLLGKYKSGGYYTFSSKDVKAFLDYKLAYNGGLLA